MKVDLRARLDDLETAAFRAMVEARRCKDETEGELSALFNRIEALINAYEEAAE